MGHKLVLIGGKKAGMEIPISMPKCVIGRGDDCHIRPQSQLVSRRHCVISTSNGSAAIEDCGSANGTLVNGEKVERQRELKNNDRIQIGSLEFEVRLATSKAVAVARRPQSARGAGDGAVSAKPLSGNGATKKQPTGNMPKAPSRTIASANLLGDEADLLGWLDSGSNGNAKKVVLPAAKPVAKALSPAARPPTNLRLAPGNGNNTETAHPQAGERTHAGGAVPLARAGKSVGTTNQAAAELLGDIGNLFDGSLGQVAGPLQNSAWEVSNLLCDGPAVPDLQEENQTDKEWDGSDLLMLASVGPLLVVILSWWFPLSWPERFSVGVGVKWVLTNWWHTWWLRWGLVAVLAAALIKLLRVRARSKRRVRT